MLQKALDFLFDLNKVSFTDSSKLQFKFAIDWLPLVMIVLVSLSLFALGYWSYMRQTASPNKRLAMGIIRGLTLAGIFLLFCRPQLVLEYKVPTPSTVAVWLDSSSSMALEDPYKDPAMMDLIRRVTDDDKIDKTKQVRANRYQLALNQLRAATDEGGWLTEMVKHQNVIFFSGGASQQKIGMVTALGPEEVKRGESPVEGINLFGLYINPVWLLLLIPVALGTLVLVLFTKTSAKAWRIAWVAAPAVCVGLILVLAVIPRPRAVATTKPEEKNDRVKVKMEELKAQIDLLAKIKPEAANTDVPMVIARINDYVTREGNKLSGIVLLTDGRTTTGTSNEVAYEAITRAGGGAQLYPVAIGQNDPPLDLAIVATQMPSGVFVKDPVSVTVIVQWSGLDAPTRVKVTLDRVFDDGTSRHLTDKTVELPKGSDKKEVELVFRPDKEIKDQKSETYKLVARVTPVDALKSDELTLENNSARGSLRVFDAKMNVLYVEGYPRWEYRYLKTEFIRETTVNISTLLLSAEPEQRYEGDFVEDKSKPGGYSFAPVPGFPETKEALDKFDVILIGDVPPEFFSPTQMKLLADHVRKDGAGLGWIAGPNHNPDSYANTPLAEFLPVEPDDANRPVLPPPDGKGFTLSLTAEGKQSNLFRMSPSGTREDDQKQVKLLPEMYWYKPVLRAKRGAEVLAVHPTRLDLGQQMPLLVTIPVGKGRTLFSSIRDTWRWRYYTGEPLFQTYWLQMARLLFHDRQMQQTNRRATISTAGASIDVDGELQITLDIKDPTLTKTLGDRVRVNIFNKKDNLKVDSLELTQTREDRYEGHLTMRDPGQFQAISETPGLVGELDPLEITVEPPKRERENLNIDKQGLERFAQRSGGVYNEPLTANASLIKNVPNRTEDVIKQTPEDLWYKPISLIIIIILLSTEWLIRKSSGLI